MNQNQNENKNEEKSKKFTDNPHVNEYFYLISGSFIVAIAFNLFLNPNGIAPGGVSGLSTIIQFKFGIEPAYTQWALNIPLFIAGIFILGKRFGIKTFVGSIVLPFFIFITKDFAPLTSSLLLASVYGGLGVGIGLGLVFRGKASTGGTDLAAQLLHKFTGISLGGAILVMDGLVVFTAGVVFGPENALYALISLFITSKTIDMVQIGLSYAKVALIVSDNKEKLGQAILKELDRGVTIVNATGGFTGNDKHILMVVFPQNEITKLKEIIRSVDPDAFVIVSNAHEVLGKGFKSHF